mgnify:CR=1 FL=1|jgi:hypothetical protein
MKKRFIVLTMILSMIASCFYMETKSEAAQLYTSVKNIQQGGKLTISLYFYYGSKKPKWSTSNKKIKIVKRSKRSCTIKGVKKGTAYVKCKIGNKTYKRKVTVKAKSKVTYANFNRVKAGMFLEDVEDILGYTKEVDYATMHTDEEYKEYEEMQAESGGWEDYLWKKQVVYVWRNPWTYHRIYVTFNDGVCSSKQYW